MKYIKIKQAIECPDMNTVIEPNNKSNNPGFERFYRILFFLKERKQTYFYCLISLIIKSRNSKVVSVYHDTLLLALLLPGCTLHSKIKPELSRI